MYKKTSKKLSFLLVFALVITNLFGFGLVNTAQAEDGDGTWDNPYTVAQAIEIQDGSIASVTGYVVGQPVSASTVNIEGFTNDYAIAIADTEGETDITKMLYIQVASGFRAGFGLQSNPDLMGKQVKVTGTLTPYFTPHPGLKSITAIEEVTEAGTDPVAATGVTLDQETATLEVGEELTLVATVEPADATNTNVTWSSSDDAIATVAGGTVTAVAEGIATITVTTEDGDFTDTCDITVIPVAQEEVLTIAEVRALADGESVTTVGIVTGLIGNNAFIQDDTAGIYLYSGSTTRSEFAVGNEIKVKGETTEYKGLKEIGTITSVEVLSTDNQLPATQELTIGEIDEDVEGELVKITEVEVTSVPSTEKTNGYSVRVTDGTNEIDLRVDSYLNLGIPSLVFTVGDTVSVIAPVGQYDVYQLMLRSQDDVVVKEDDEILATDLFISEYIEGSSNNKAIEIFNGTGAEVDLSAYTVELYSNGSTTPGNTLVPTGTLAHGDVYVIANASADPTIQAIADITSTVTYFNGDDALVLRHNDEIIDVFGQVGFDPGSVWGTGDITTGEHTLVRKATITAGDTNPDDPFDPALEWDSYPQDTFGYLGSHTMGEGGQEPDTTSPIITHTPVTSSNILDDITITATVTDENTVDSVDLYYRTVGDTEYNIAPMTPDGDDYTAVIPSAELNIAGLQYYIEASDGANTATSPENINYPYEVTISSEDITPPEVTSLTPASGSATGTDLRPEISADYSDASGIDVASVELYMDDVDVTDLATITETMITYIPDTDLSEGDHTVRLVVSDMAPTPQTAIVEWNFYVGEREYDFYFGQLHSHTGEISDGQGTLDEAYAWARDMGHADFFAVTDHSNWFDNQEDTSNEDITDVSQSTSDDWKKMNATADSYNADGEYVAIAGFEMTWSGSTGGWGHINTFNTPWFASRSNSAMDLPAYYDHIAADTDSISQLNHPGTTFGDFADFGYYSEAADSVVHLIEVGNGEGLVGSSGYFPSYEYYTRALDKGWHVAPSNNQDNHLGNWITANDARTVVIGTELTREGIFDAIRDLRVYSTEDKNLEIMYTVNDSIMGSTLDEPESLSIYIDIYDPDETDEIGTVSIISNGGVEVASKTFDDNQALWELELDPQYSYYYVRVDQADDEIAVTAPVWTSEVTPVGISKVEVSQDPQIVGESIDISATVYNNGSSDINDILVEFYKDSLEGEKIGEATITSIESGSADAATIEWTSNITGKYNIYAKTVINVGGGDKVFTGSTSVTFANPEDVTKVVLDMAHYNAYVSGDYAGKDLTLREMFKDRGYMLVENWDELTAEDLENAQLLIITDPQSTDSTTYNLEKSLFTDAEVAAIKGYTDNGGDLIICSKADYRDGVGEYSNGVQLNKILQAIDTNLRVNDDEVVDDVDNGGQPYRLYFDRYVSTKYNLTDNIPEGTTYSFYSGCSVILKDGGSEEAVDWLVQGHETTGTIDSDYQDDNVPVEEGNVYVIGAEILPSGAKIVAAGTIFFSDFETASSDNMYSNKQITENILDWMIETEEVELKTIAEVRADEDNDGIPDFLGQKFTVEGRVTAQSEAVTPKNAFFEVIYVQDETGGITVFGVSTTPLPLGTKVRVTGTVDQYSGDTELSLENETKDIVIVDSNPVLVEPIEMTTGDSMLEENEGWLVKIEGIVTRMTDNSLFLDDGTGEARVYVNGYIGDGTDNPDMLGSWDPTIKVGDTVSAIGLASEDPDGHRLRVRNTGEIVKVEEWIEPLYPIEAVDVNVTDVFGSEGTIFNKGDMVIVNTALKSVSRNDHSGVVIVELLDDHGKIYGTTMICEDLFMAGEDKEYTLAFEMTGLKKGTHTARVYIVNNLIERKMISEEATANFLVEFGNKGNKKK